MKVKLIHKKKILHLVKQKLNVDDDCDRILLLPMEEHIETKKKK